MALHAVAWLSVHRLAGLEGSSWLHVLTADPARYGGFVLAAVFLLLEGARPRVRRALGVASLEERLLSPYPGAACPAWRGGPSAHRILGAGWAWLGWVVLMATFLDAKAAIPELNPFAWDVHLMELDRWLHGGRDPWRILQPLLGHPAATRALDVAYYAWFPVGITVFAWQSVSRHRRTRLRFLLTVGLAWTLLGNGAAMLFSSAGPVYWAEVTGLAEPFADQLAYLARVDAEYGLATLRIRELLWEGHVAGGPQPTGGIAAMPSMHVALPALFTLLCRKRQPVLAAAFLAYTAVILVGSVHLGWHYAVDGYVALAAVPVLWWAAGRFVAWYAPRFMERGAPGARPPPGGRRRR